RAQCPHARYTAPTSARTYTLSLHDALPIYLTALDTGKCGQTSSAPMSSTCTTRIAVKTFNPFIAPPPHSYFSQVPAACRRLKVLDRKSTRLNSSHVSISYAVFCLKKKTIHSFLAIPTRRGCAGTPGCSCHHACPCSSGLASARTLATCSRTLPAALLTVVV